VASTRPAKLIPRYLDMFVTIFRTLNRNNCRARTLGVPRFPRWNLGLTPALASSPSACSQFMTPDPSSPVCDVERIAALDQLAILAGWARPRLRSSTSSRRIGQGFQGAGAPPLLDRALESGSKFGCIVRQPDSPRLILPTRKAGADFNRKVSPSASPQMSRECS